MLPLNLSKAEIQKLKYERFHYPCPIVQKRLTAVLLFATVVNASLSTIGLMSGLHRHSVVHWVKVYEKEGIESLFMVNYGTNQSKLEKHTESIISSFQAKPPMHAREAKARIEQMTGMSRSPTQVRSFMHRHGLHYIKMGHIPAKANTEQQKQWVETTLNPVITEAQKGECHLLFMDAAHFILEPFICAIWCITRLFIKASSGRNRINVLGVFNAMTKEILTLSNTTYINADTIIEFFKRLRLYYGVLPIKIVLDNARYQHCQVVEQAAKALNITLLFLPSYSPNLNIIERLWKFTREKILYGEYYETPEKFHKAITNFFQTINQKYKSEIKNRLTLKFQFFDNENVQFYPV
jgi:transposase